MGKIDKLRGIYRRLKYPFFSQKRFQSLYEIIQTKGMQSVVLFVKSHKANRLKQRRMGKFTPSR